MPDSRPPARLDGRPPTDDAGRVSCARARVAGSVDVSTRSASARRTWSRWDGTMARRARSSSRNLHIKSLVDDRCRRESGRTAASFGRPMARRRTSTSPTIARRNRRTSRSRMVSSITCREQDRSAAAVLVYPVARSRVVCSRCGSAIRGRRARCSSAAVGQDGPGLQRGDHAARDPPRLLRGVGFDIVHTTSAFFFPRRLTLVSAARAVARADPVWGGSTWCWRP